MAAAKTSSTLQASASNSAGGTISSSTLALSTAYGATVTAQITNGATAPTAACQAILQISPDGSTWYTYAVGTASLAVSAVTTFAWDLPASIMNARVQFTGNTGQAVTVAAQAQTITAI